MGISFAGLSGGGKVQKTEIIKSTQSWTAPDDVTEVDILMAGGGSGGSNFNNGSFPSFGGTGSVDERLSVPVTPGASYTVSIGAGGALNSAGGSSSFGNLFTVQGAREPKHSNGNFIGDHTTTYGGLTGAGIANSGFSTNAGLGYKGLGGGGGAVLNVFTLHPGYGGGMGTSNNEPQQIPGRPGVINTGGGGGIGGGNVSPNQGGSGVCYITYWTAG